MSDGKPSQSPSLDSAGRSLIVKTAIIAAIVPVLLFIAAGRIDWPAAWVFTAFRLAFFAAVTIWLVRRDPALMNERGRTHEDAKSWDQIVMAFYLPLAFVVVVVAGLDHRYGWSSEAPLAQVLGFIGLAFSHLLPTWAISVNTYLSSQVRIQSDRGHEVVTSGPYRLVRHPMYVGTILMWPCAAVALGSWWAVLPAALCSAVFVIRTAMEDQTLRSELPGYLEYAATVRYRLVPGLW